MLVKIEEIVARVKRSRVTAAACVAVIPFEADLVSGRPDLRRPRKKASAKCAR
jgi:hypothetical protein